MREVVTIFFEPLKCTSVDSVDTFVLPNTSAFFFSQTLLTAFPRRLALVLRGLVPQNRRGSLRKATPTAGHAPLTGSGRSTSPTGNGSRCRRRGRVGAAVRVRAAQRSQKKLLHRNHTTRAPPPHTQHAPPASLATSSRYTRGSILDAKTIETTRTDRPAWVARNLVIFGNRDVTSHGGQSKRDDPRRKPRSLEPERGGGCETRIPSTARVARFPGMPTERVNNREGRGG